jgi:hypothetical protein
VQTQKKKNKETTRKHSTIGHASHILSNNLLERIVGT